MRWPFFVRGGNDQSTIDKRERAQAHFNRADLSFSLRARNKFR